jgi:hypothetical protein
MSDHFLGRFDPNTAIPLAEFIPVDQHRILLRCVRAACIGVRLLKLQNGNWLDRFVFGLTMWRLER